MSLLKSLSEPRIWVLLFVFLCQLVFASPELMLICMAIAGTWLFLRRRKQPNFTALPVAAGHAMWLVPLFFVSVFFFKLLSATWALVPKEAIDSAFNSFHFLLWPALVVYIRNANLSVRRAEPWIAGSMLVLMLWYLGARFFFPMSIDAQCFKAGAHNCGLLGQTMAFMLLWLFIAVTRPDSRGVNRMLLVGGLLAGWIAFLGTIRRTEMLGLLFGMAVVLVWRFNERISIKRVVVTLGLCVVVLVMAWPVMASRFSIVTQEVSMYFQGGAARGQALHTSVGARLEMYRVALEAIEERPFLGWGAGLKPRDVPQYATDPQNPYAFSNFHQQYLQVILEVGLIGGLLAFIMVGYICRQMIVVPWRQGHRELVAIVAALFFTYAWKALANGALLYSVTNSVFVFFSAWVWAELMCANNNARLDQLPVHS
jgi:O-antigen ligase